MSTPAIEQPISAEPIPGLDFVSIDFETANSKRASVCQIGLVKVRDGIPGKTHCAYVMPPPGFQNFGDWNIKIHGITRGTLDREGADPWALMLPRLVHFAGDLPLVAHNASVERSIIIQATEAIGGEVPEFEYLCTQKLAQRWLPDADSYKLNRLVEDLALPGFQHHNAGEDAAAAAHLAIHIARTTGISDLGTLWPTGTPRTRRRAA